MAEVRKADAELIECTAAQAEIFETLKEITGKEYEVTYLDVEGAEEEDQQAIADGNVEAELAASH